MNLRPLFAMLIHAQYKMDYFGEENKKHMMKTHGCWNSKFWKHYIDCNFHDYHNVNAIKKYNVFTKRDSTHI